MKRFSIVENGYDVDEGGTSVHKPSLNEIVVNGYTEGETSVNGLQTRVSSLELDVQGNMDATPNPVLGLKREVEGYEQSGSHVNGLLDNVEDLQHKMDGWTEGSTNHPSLYTSTLGNNGNDWVGQPGSIAAQVKTNTTDIANIKGEIGSLYSYKGDVYAVEPSSGNTTKLITSPNGSTEVNISDIEKGWTYNVNPVSGDSITITLDGVKYTYSKGTNIAWIEDTSVLVDGRFDELGAVIDVGAIEQEIDDVRTDVTTLKNKSGTYSGTSWDTGTLTGTFIFNATVTTSSSGTTTTTLYVFISSLNNGAISATPDYVDLSNNFTNGFEVTGNKIALKSGASSATINWNKIS